MIEYLPHGEIEEWRGHPVTVAYVKSLELMRQRLEWQLFQAGSDSPLDRVRFISGQLHAVNLMSKMIKETRGKEE